MKKIAIALKIETGMNNWDQICFVISPIGRDGSLLYSEFEDVFNDMIEPSIIRTGYGFEIKRSDKILRSGSVLQDIWEHVIRARIVIADLTYQNPNVLYELAVRHAISRRAILIANVKSENDLPFDLKDCRTIFYKTSEIKDYHKFSQRIKDFIEDIIKESRRPDNPILDKIITEAKDQIKETTKQDRALKSDTSKNGSTKPLTTSTILIRLKRIFEFMDAKPQPHGMISLSINGKKISLVVPAKRGNFKLYVTEENETAPKIFYVSFLAQKLNEANIEQDLADMRKLIVTIKERLNEHDIETTFIIAIDDKLNVQHQSLTDTFERMKNSIFTNNHKPLSLEIWDREIIAQKEIEFGIKPEIAK